MESQAHTLSGSDTIASKGIPSDADHLEKELAHLHETLAVMTDRLAPVLRPADDGPDRGLASLMEGPPSEVSQRLRGFASGVGEARLRVDTILARLDL